MRPPLETQITPVTVYHLCEVATLRTSSTIVFVLEKADDTRRAVEPIAAARRCRAGGGLQNGLLIDDVASIWGTSRTIGAVNKLANMFPEPGIVNRQNAPANLVVRGRARSTRRTQPRAAEGQRCLRQAGTVEILGRHPAGSWRMKPAANAGAAAFLADPRRRARGRGADAGRARVR